MFSFSASAPDLTAPVLLLCALAFPLADTALYQGSLWAEKVGGGEVVCVWWCGGGGGMTGHDWVS